MFPAANEKLTLPRNFDKINCCTKFMDLNDSLFHAPGPIQPVGQIINIHVFVWTKKQNRLQISPLFYMRIKSSFTLVTSEKEGDKVRLLIYSICVAICISASLPYHAPHAYHLGCPIWKNVSSRTANAS